MFDNSGAEVNIADRLKANVKSTAASKKVLMPAPKAQPIDDDDDDEEDDFNDEDDADDEPPVQSESSDDKGKEEESSGPVQGHSNRREPG